jgi:hypothetical protein
VRGAAAHVDVRRPAYAAAGLAFASAAVSLFWTLGGTLLLDTVRGAIEDLARDRSAAGSPWRRGHPSQGGHPVCSRSR